MSPITRTFFTAPVAWLAALAATLGMTAQAENLLHARISHESGGALVRGTDDADWSYATINTIILPGDTLWIDQEGTLEVEMSGGSFLRMADRSKAELQTLPPSASINAWTGSFYVQRVSRSTGDVKLRTPAATINIDRDTQARVDVVGEGSTTVSVRWGRATIVTEGGAPIEATNGQRVYIDPGLLPSNPVPFDKTVEDSFDAWNRERARLLALGDTALPTSVRVDDAPIGYSDLASYGEWVYVDNRQYWRPTIVQDYIPYRDGYWSYGPAYGYSWTGSYPFCYVTSHYGRWNYYPAYGWLWGYDPVWSPAWCATAYYGGNFVWCPINYYNQPCSYGATFVVGGIPFSISYSSYCRAPDLYYGPCSVYPAYSNLFVNVNANDIYIWNIYSDNFVRSYPNFKYPSYGSTALFRDYSPRRVIRGIESGGAFTVAASQRARALNSELGRAEFASRSVGGLRSIRTSQVSTARSAQVRSASLNRDASALDTGSTIRRAQSRLESLRGTDDSKPQVIEARRSRVASLERSASEAQHSKLPGSTSRMSSARSVRTDGPVETIRGQGDRAAVARSLSTDTPLDAAAREGVRVPGGLNRKGDTSTATTDIPRQRPIDRIADRKGDDAAPSITDTPRQRPTERIMDREARRTEGAASGNSALTDITGRGRSESATSRTLDNTRVRVNAPDGAGRTQVPSTARLPEPKLPRISGGDGRNERSQSLGTIPQLPQRSRAAYNAPVQTYTPEPSTHVPQSRIIQDTSRANRIRENVQTYTPQTQAPVQMQSPRIVNDNARARYEAPQVNTPQRFEAPQQRFEAPQVNIPQRFEAPQQRFEAPQVNIPQRFEAPQQRFEAPQQRFEAPPQPRFEAPRQIERPSIGDGGGSRFESRSGGGGDGGGRGRSR
ncbi:MAG: FecR domain-containing protein [Candidatus Hydrogenedentes bacterium]|nr:FecR domain-containing protein [Candidatus Hydrogenedentota bacterium]